jgi:hypothetical protein
MIAPRDEANAAHETAIVNGDEFDDTTSDSTRPSYAHLNHVRSMAWLTVSAFDLGGRSAVSLSSCASQPVK